MEVMFDRVAGLDIGKDSVTVCVRTPAPRGRRHTETRTFRGMSRSLEVMEVWPLNAAHMQAVPGRKTDVKDAEWIAQLLAAGHPPAADADPISRSAAR